MDGKSIAARLNEVRNRVEAARTRSLHSSSAVRILAVSKLQPYTKVREAYEAGQLDFGENYVQELVEKRDQVSREIQWHVIGPLQSNKVKFVAGQVALIHSVDRLSIAEKISQVCMEHGRSPQPILIEVNQGDQSTKSGVAIVEVVELARQCLRLPGVRLNGLMSLPPLFDVAEKTRPYFSEMRELLARCRRELGAEAATMCELSMGTSHDYEVAVEEGATWVRVGTSLFGERMQRSK